MPDCPARKASYVLGERPWGTPQRIFEFLRNGFR